MLNWSGESATLVAPAEPPGRIRRWRADQDGRPAIVIQAVLNGVEEARQAGERLRRLAAHPDSSLQAVRGWAVQEKEAWAVTDPEDGSNLATVLRNGPLTPAAAAAVGWWVLTGLEVLHGAGVAHGDLTSANVYIDPSGRVALRNHLFNGGSRASGDDTRSDVEAAGVLVCAALGIPVQGRPGAPLTAAEESAPALARTVRAIANGASGGNVSGARMALAATAGPLLQPAALAAAAGELAARAPLGRPGDRPGAGSAPAEWAAAGAAGSALAPPASPPPAGPAPLPPRRYVASASDFESLREPFDRRRLVVPLAAAAGLLLLAGLGWLVLGAFRGHPTAGSSTSAAATPAARASRAPTAPPAATPAPTPTPRPSGAPTFGPAAAGDVKSVEVKTNGACVAGGQCALEVTVHTTAAGGANVVSWTIRALDSCTGKMTDVGTDKVAEQAGWTTVIGDTTVTLPSARGPLQVAAVTTAPATAASPPLTVGQGAC